MPTRPTAKPVLRPILKPGDRGNWVLSLQEALTGAGFRVPATGFFGPQTRAAVLAFQEARGLATDGLVGPETWSALGVRAQANPAPVFSCGKIQVGVDVVRRMLPGAPEANILRNLPLVLEALERTGLATEPMVRMALATIRAETAAFEPVSEGISRFNTSPGGHPFDLYDERADLGNRGRPDGERYRGRGFVQLTGRANYIDLGKRLGLELEADPELANEPTYAAAILASFLKRREAAISEAIAQGKLGRARRLINGGSHGLEAFTAAFEAWHSAGQAAGQAGEDDGRKIA